MLSFNPIINPLSTNYSNIYENVHNENSSPVYQFNINSSTIEQIVEYQLNESSSSNDVFYNKTVQTKTKSLIGQLDLKYSLIFIINFQVIIFNALIIAHVLKAKQFQKSSSARFFVASLAVSDMLVGVMVMPLGIISLMEDTWLFGKEMCIFWQLIDFFSCTASIFNLCTVSIDRYIAISKPLLYMRMGPTRVLLIIGVVWMISALITFPPVITERFQKGELYLDAICVGQNCSNCGSLFDSYPAYVVLATILSFFVPVLIVIITNYRTYLIVKRHMFARKNDGRIHSIPATKAKSKKIKFFPNLLTGRREKNRQIELNSLENQKQQQKSQPMPIILANQIHHDGCNCDKELLNKRTYLHTSTTNRSFTCAWLSQCCNWLIRRDCSNINSRIVESRIIRTAHQNPHYSSCNYQHSQHDLDNLESRKSCTQKFTRCLANCFTLNKMCNLSGRQSRFSSIKGFLFLNNNSSNAEILDDLSNLNNLKTCGYCALNSLNSLQFHKTAHHRQKARELILNEDLLVIEDESTSGSRNRGVKEREERSVSILVNSHESNANNEEIFNGNLNSLGLNEANTIESLSSVPSNGCLMNRCAREGLKADTRTSFFQSQQSNCCGHCCTLCSSECEDCRNDFNRLLADIFKSKVKRIKSMNKSTRSNSNESSCKSSFNKAFSNKTSTTKTSLSSKSNKTSEPQQRSNCSHFNTNHLNHNISNSKTFIRCDYCGNTLLQPDQSKSSTKTLCLHRFAKGQISSKKIDSCLLKDNFHGQKYCRIKFRLDKNNLEINHHCVHSHIQHLNNNHFNHIYIDPMSVESNKKEDSSHSAINSADKCDEASSSTSDYRRANNSSFDELRINCGTGQLQKSIGLNWSQSRKSPIGGNSSTNSDGNSKSSRSKSAAKLKKLAYFAGNSVRNVGFRSSNSNNRLNTIRREYKATKTLAIITFVFVCMWLPYFTIFLLEAICKDCYLVKHYFSPFLSRCLFLGWSNSYVNCLLYMYFSRKLRNSIINSLLCRKN